MEGASSNQTPQKGSPCLGGCGTRGKMSNQTSALWRGHAKLRTARHEADSFVLDVTWGGDEGKAEQ